MLPKLVLADAERPRGHHPPGVGDGRIGERLSNDRNLDAPLLIQLRGIEHRLGEIALDNVRGKKWYTRCAWSLLVAKQLDNPLSAKREFPVAGGGFRSELLQYSDHIGARELQRRVGAVQRIPPVEQQSPVRASLRADGLNERGHPVHATDLAIGLRQCLIVFRRERVRATGLRGYAECLEEVRSRYVWRTATRTAHTQVDRRLAEIDRKQLRVAVSYVENSQLAFRSEAKQVFLPHALLRRYR